MHSPKQVLCSQQTVRDQNRVFFTPPFVYLILFKGAFTDSTKAGDKSQEKRSATLTKKGKRGNDSNLCLLLLPALLLCRVSVLGLL